MRSPDGYYVSDGVSWKRTWQQDHEFCQRVELSDPVQLIYEERGVNKRIAKPHAFHGRASVVSNSFYFQLKDHSEGARGNFQGFLQRGDALSVARVQPLHLLQGHPRHEACFIGSTIDAVIVQQHEMAVIGFP